LLSRMGMAAVCVLQDAACASFQANTSTACIVDIGHSKTSVSVVEEGCCIPCCCHHLPYGAHDISRVLLWVLQRGGWGAGSGEAAGLREGSRGARGKGGGAAALEGFEAAEPAHQVCPKVRGLTAKRAPCDLKRDRLTWAAWQEELRQLRERVCYLLGPQEEVRLRFRGLGFGFRVSGVLPARAARGCESASSSSPHQECMCVCVCVCVRARARACACVCVCVCPYFVLLSSRSIC